MNERDWHLRETYKSLIINGNNAVKFVLLINGGAVISLLTFLGNFTINNHEIDMIWPMGCFLLGIVFGGFASITAYMTQFALYNEEIEEKVCWSHTKWLILSFVLVVFGVLLFGAGAILALLEIRAYSSVSMP